MPWPPALPLRQAAAAAAAFASSSSAEEDGLWSTTASSASTRHAEEKIDRQHFIWGRIERVDGGEDDGDGDSDSEVCSASSGLPDLSDICFREEPGLEAWDDVAAAAAAAADAVAAVGPMAAGGPELAPGRSAEGGGVGERGAASSMPATLMLRNLPSRVTRQELMDELLEFGTKASELAFMYMPVKPDGLSRGFAFVGFHTPEQTSRFWGRFEGHIFMSRNSKKRVALAVARIQGAEQLFAEFPTLRECGGFFCFDDYGGA